MAENKTIEWRDAGREATCPPDPAYPKGKEIRLADGIESKCVVDLPYPAPRCGMYLVSCCKCGVTVGVTTAGRPDDPRSVEIPCLLPPRVPRLN